MWADKSIHRSNLLHSLTPSEWYAESAEERCFSCFHRAVIGVKISLWSIQTALTSISIIPTLTNLCYVSKLIFFPTLSSLAVVRLILLAGKTAYRCPKCLIWRWKPSVVKRAEMQYHKNTATASLIMRQTALEGICSAWLHAFKMTRFLTVMSLDVHICFIVLLRDWFNTKPWSR